MATHQQWHHMRVESNKSCRSTTIENNSDPQNSSRNNWKQSTNSSLIRTHKYFAITGFLYKTKWTTRTCISNTVWKYTSSGTTCGVKAKNHAAVSPLITTETPTTEAEQQRAKQKPNQNTQIFCHSRYFIREEVNNLDLDFKDSLNNKKHWYAKRGAKAKYTYKEEEYGHYEEDIPKTNPTYEICED